MTKENIDELYRLAKERNIESIKSLIKKLEEEINNNVEKSEDIDILLKQVLDDETLNLPKAIKLRLVKLIQNVEYIKQYIESDSLGLNKLDLLDLTDFKYIDNYLRNEGSQLSEMDKMRLILSARNTEYIKQCIEDESLQLDDYIKSQLILSTKDAKYIKSWIDRLDVDKDELAELIKATGDIECIRKGQKDGIVEQLTTDEILKLVKEAHDVECVEKCLNDESLDIYKHHKVSLICSTVSVEYVDKYIRDESLQLDSNDRYWLVLSTGNIEYIDKCIRDESLDLDIDKQVNLIESTREKEYIDRCIRDESLGLMEFHKVRLIVSLKDMTYIDECVKDESLKLSPYSKFDLISKTDDSEYIKTCINDDSLGLGTNHKVCLIIQIREIEYTDQCMKDDSLGFDEESKVSLIKAMKNVEYTDRCIMDESLGLTKESKLELIRATNDLAYVKKWIKDESLGLSETEKILILLNTRNEDFIRDTLKELGIENKIQKSITLPENMTIGVEIEAEGTQLIQAIFNGWEAKWDASLEKGLEIVSPILTGNQIDSENIYIICDMLKKLNCNVSERCGGHVHVGVDYLTSNQAYMNLIELWGNLEEILYVISNAEGDVTRENGVGKYAQPLSGEIEKALEKGSINLNSEDELSNFVSQIRSIQKKTVDRYSGINFQSMDKHNTIEFRLANGTINPDTWIENINLFGGIIKASEQLAQIQAKDEQSRTEQDVHYLELFEMIKRKEIPEREKLDALLDLTISKEEKNIYERRYEVNSELLQNHPIVKEHIAKKVAKKPIKVKDIGKKSIYR